MKPSELYAMTPEKTDSDIFVLTGWEFNHVPEIDWSLMNAEAHKQTRIVINYYKDFDFDGRRFWRLASVWLDDIRERPSPSKPVMIIQNAGREGDDWHKRFITDSALYQEMVAHLHSLTSMSSIDIKDELCDPEEDIKNLTEFYGNKLDGLFERYSY